MRGVKDDSTGDRLQLNRGDNHLRSNRHRPPMGHIVMETPVVALPLGSGVGAGPPDASPRCSTQVSRTSDRAPSPSQAASIAKRWHAQATDASPWFLMFRRIESQRDGRSTLDRMEGLLSSLPRLVIVGSPYPGLASGAVAWRRYAARSATDLFACGKLYISFRCRRDRGRCVRRGDLCCGPVRVWHRRFDCCSIEPPAEKRNSHLGPHRRWRELRRVGFDLPPRCCG